MTKNVNVYDEGDHYEVREPGKGIPGNFEQGQWHANFEHHEDAKAYADRINNINKSHLPDLSERLIETHRILQMAREYLMPMSIDNRAFNHACDNILDAMGDIELAIAKLQQP